MTIISLCLFMWVLLSSALPLRHAQPPLINVFLLAGQSNMAGRGGVVAGPAAAQQVWDGVVPPACRPTPSVLRLDAGLAWAEAREPLHAGIDAARGGGGAVGVGPGMAFARAVLAGSREGWTGAVGLVPCAEGGTNITQWEKGGALYRRLLRRARAAVAGSGGGSVRALLWYQGESDTIFKHDAESYGRRLERLFGDVRMDLLSPMLPIIQVALASGEGPFVETVRKAQFGTDLLNLRTIDAEGLELRSDNLHLTTEAEVRVGEMMGEAFLEFLPTHLTAANAINTTIQATNSALTTTSSNPSFALVLPLLALLWGIIHK